MEDGHIRAYEARDFPDMNRIRARAFAPVFASFRQIVGATVANHAFRGLEREQEAHLKDICRPDSPQEIYVFEADGRIHGFCTCSFDETGAIGEIGLNAVHPDSQGRGIATRLYAFVLERMRTRGMAVAMVGTGGDASHSPARRAYERAGFTAAIPGLYLYRAL